MEKNYVIVGNSAAAIGCVEGIRQVDTKGSILIVSDEPHHTYSRPLISYLLWGKTDRQRMKYRPDSFYEDNKVDTLFGVKATALHPEEHTLELDNGETVTYGKLLLATGSRPFIPPMEGLDKVEKKFTFMTLNDALALEEAITPDSKVLIVGAGLIGLKCAEGIFEKVASLTVVDLANRILPSILDEEGSKLVQEYIEKKGVKFYLSDSVAKFEEGVACLNSGAEVEYDVVVIAVGVRPNVELAQQAGIDVNRGILTDVHCATSAADVYAAGDCTVSHNIASDQDQILALLPNAYMQGETAGIEMAGGEANYDKAIPMNAMGMLGLHMITAGVYDGEVYKEQNCEGYKKLFVKDGKLKGYILIGDVIKRAGIYTSLIREQTPLDEIDFDLIKHSPQLMAFAKKERKVKLAGAKE
ncbi:MAG TPA: NAD(P)/FAD-dependent oxidoreductase [Candidatus Egerieicola faecale]|uniref:NAD(P)/FAD-dependent oxidoreductase n=1 Tax=Candidatus Egerieicola faecale TaxID=2840774 RepID=A0A9D1IV07_9FIRM|nr:NAD(P)/FAD-dependent oxidoreductase [Candidatus Egerieicola faecale]